MLNSLRNHTGGIAAKIMLALLSLSFVVWGIGDIVNGQRNKTLAKVGGISITESEFQNEFNQKVEGFRRILGANYSPELIKNLGIQLQVLNDIINSTMLKLEADKVGIALSDEAVMEQIRNTPAFQDQNGKFDKTIFFGTIRSLGMNEKDLVEKIRQDASNNLLLQSVADVNFTPGNISRLLYAARNEERQVDILTISDRQLDAIPSPDDETLANYLRDHAEAFTAPEYRQITYITLAKQSLSGADKEEAVYKATTALNDELASGSTLEEAAEKLNLPLKTVGPVAADGTGTNGKPAAAIPAYKDFLQNAFAAEEGLASDIILSNNGIYYALRVDNITLPAARNLQDVKSEVAKAWTADEKRRMLNEKANEIATALTAAENKQPVIASYRLSAASSSRFTRQSSKFANSTTAPQEFFDEVFTLPAGASSKAYPLTNGNFIIGLVKKVTPAKPSQNAEAYEPLARELVGNYQQEIAQQYMGYLREKYSVSVNDDAIRSVQE